MIKTESQRDFESHFFQFNAVGIFTVEDIDYIFHCLPGDHTSAILIYGESMFTIGSFGYQEGYGPVGEKFYNNPWGYIILQSCESVHTIRMLIRNAVNIIHQKRVFKRYEQSEFYLPKPYSEEWEVDFNWDIRFCNNNGIVPTTILMERHRIDIFSRFKLLVDDELYFVNWMKKQIGLSGIASLKTVIEIVIEMLKGQETTNGIKNPIIIE
jgi:hypothetical protein